MKVFIYLSSGEQSRSLLLLLLSSYLFTPYDLKSYYAFKEKKKNKLYILCWAHVTYKYIYYTHIIYTLIFISYIFGLGFSVAPVVTFRDCKGFGFPWTFLVVKGTVHSKSKSGFLSPVVLFIHLYCFGVSRNTTELNGPHSLVLKVPRKWHSNISTASLQKSWAGNWR